MGDAVKHTPGPWKASQTYPLGDYCIHARGIPFQLAYLAAHSKVDWPIEANARLIAAAPDLLAAIKEVVEKFDACTDSIVRNTPLGINKARSAIAKATGAQQ